MKFRVIKQSKKSKARLGELTLPHGKVMTPVFMPVGTSAIVKTLSPAELEAIGAEIMLSNTYHLHVRPGEDLISKMGGLHKWAKWSKPILTDSGGYQAFSLSRAKQKMAKINDEGVRFYSHIDGKKLWFTPESAIDIQRKIGSDITMVLDDCAPYPATEKRLFQAVKRTGEWAKRSIDYWQEQGMGEQGRALFGIVQGGVDKEMRQQSLKDIQNLPFDGIAIGGVSVGEGKENMRKSVDYIADDLDPSRPHYLMGVGDPVDLIEMIDKGIDMFDCVLATRLARHGAFWTSDYKRADIGNAQYVEDERPLDEECDCPTCQNYSRSFLRHLFINKEMFALRALTLHNLAIIFRLIKKIRTDIEQK